MFERVAGKKRLYEIKIINQKRIFKKVVFVGCLRRTALNNVFEVIKTQKRAETNMGAYLWFVENRLISIPKVAYIRAEAKRLNSVDMVIHKL